jgi:CheY-like chemotaxis protein
LAQAAAGKAAPAPKRRVLIVEDNLDSVHLLAVLVRSMGYEADFAINGYAALEVAERFRPDIVLLDLALPDISGWTVARQLRRSPRCGGARIYAVTGHYGPAERDRSLAAGCDDHLLKPLDPAFLESLLGMES